MQGLGKNIELGLVSINWLEDNQMIKRTIFAIILILISSHYAYAQFNQGNKLHNICVNRGESGLYKMYINGYVAGIIDLGLLTDMKKQMCLPSGAMSEQMTDVFCKFLLENPAKRTESGAALVSQSLIKAFPCNE